jgi:hypothetical protein
MLTSLLFTLGWWIAASAISFTHTPLTYFGSGILGIVLLAWAFGLFRSRASLGQTVAVSVLSIVVLVIAFLAIGFIAGSAEANSQSPISVGTA